MAMNERDIMLVAAAKNGDNRSFEELYGLYYNKVFTLARMTVKNEADAEDILQQAFINAWQNLNMLTNPAAFNAWIQKITLNLCYSLLRKKNIAILLDAENDMADFGDETLDSNLLPALYAERDDLRARLGKIIDGLSEVQKQTVVLYYFNELKVEEIAYIMECNSGTVKSRLFLARNTIRSEIEEQETRSGQKFYGVAGIPMLPFAELLAQQIGAHTISPTISSSIFNSISQAISQSAASAVQGVAQAGPHMGPQAGSQVASAATGNAPGAITGATSGVAGTAVKAGTPLFAKILVGVVAVALLIGSGLLVWYVGNGDGNSIGNNGAGSGVANGAVSPTTPASPPSTANDGVQAEDSAATTLPQASTPAPSPGASFSVEELWAISGSIVSLSLRDLSVNFQ